MESALDSTVQQTRPAPPEQTRAVDPAETYYEKNQRFNALTRWLHGFRYRNILALLRELSEQVGDRPLRVFEIGCAHGKLFDVLDREFSIEYVGVELNPLFFERARDRLEQRPNFTGILGSATDPAVYERVGHPDVVVAMETLEHIPEHDVVRIVERIAALEPRMFICSVPCEVGPALWFKNVGSLLTGYVRHKSYRWRDTFWAGLYQLDRLPPHGTGHRGFDWRWLAQTIRHSMRIREIRRSPLQVVPPGLALSVMFVAVPRKTS